MGRNFRFARLAVLALVAGLISGSAKAALPAQPVPRAIYVGVQLFQKYDQTGGMAQVVMAVKGCYQVMSQPGPTLGKLECLGEDSSAYEMSIAMQRQHGFPPLPFYTEQHFFGRVMTVLKNAGVHPAAERSKMMSGILMLAGQDYQQIESGAAG